MRQMLIIVLAGVLSALVVSCSFASQTPDASATLRAVYTSQAGTIQALETQAGPFSAAANTPVAPTILPPNATSFVSATQADGSCNSAVFVQDVTIPDGSKLAPGEVFTKTWRLKNSGTCTWNTAYTLVFSSGNVMSGASPTKLAANVKPGETVDISIALTAPSQSGSYRGYWLLRSDAGFMFGVGSVAPAPFFVDIVVASPANIPLDFTANYCSAVWKSGSGAIDCPGSINNARGYIAVVENPKLESGEIYAGKALLSVPENSVNGYIQGTYPEYIVQQGDHFRSIVNCDFQATGCSALFRLDYQIGNGSVQTLWQFAEAYEGKYYAVDVDLSPLAGYSVRFTLTVVSAGPAGENKAVWAGPRIERP